MFMVGEKRTVHHPDFLCDGMIFPESPRWHRGNFYCCSIDEGTIFRISPDGSREIVVVIDDWLSGWIFAHSDSDEIILSSGRRRKLLCWDGKVIQEIADLTDIATFGIHDMVGTEDGMIFVDCINFRFGEVALSEVPKSPLIRVDPSCKSAVVSNRPSFPNGLVITPDRKRLIAADSLQASLHQWDLDPDGNLLNHRMFATIPGSVPDGICMDEEGGIWVSSGHRGVFRVLDGGEITDRVDMGTTGATACMLGGDDRRTLLITASDSFDRVVINRNPSGRLFTVRVKVSGAGLPSWY